MAHPVQTLPSSTPVIELLRALLPGVHRLSIHELEALADLLTLRRLARGESLLVPGQVCVEEGLVIRGCLRVHMADADGSARVLYFAPEGWYVADVDSFAHRQPAVLGIDALEPAEVLVIGTAQRQALLERGPEGDRILRMLAETALVGLQQRLTGSLRRTAAERYREFRRLYPGLDARIAQYHIASYVGISPEFLSKLRTRLIRDDAFRRPPRRARRVS